jgi:hypothetical protein
VGIEEDKMDLKSIVEDHTRAIHELNVIQEARYTGMSEADIEFKASSRPQPGCHITSSSAIMLKAHNSRPGLAP